jgi:hypothetical protein
VTFGPEHEAASPHAAEPKLPGEFVSEDMRADCARFLDDLRARGALRRESRLTGDWLPARAVKSDSRTELT